MTILLYYYITILLYYYITILLYYDITILLYYYRRLGGKSTGKSFRFVRACERAKLRVPARRCCFPSLGKFSGIRVQGRAARRGAAPRALPFGVATVWETIF